jgi:arabinofuranosyltransferase
VVAALVVPALLQVAYLISIGGDYVNGRLLVVPLLALLAPISVVGADRFTAKGYDLRALFIGATAVLVVWAGVSGTTLRPPYNLTSADFLNSRFDAREIAVREWVGKPPTHMDDYSESFLAGPYKDLVQQYEAAGGDLMVIDDPYNGGTLQLPKGDGPVVASTTIGALGVVSGIDTRIIDRLALADPIASHLPAEGTTAGHLRRLPVPWVYARMGLVADPPSKAAAKAQTCGALAQILSDTSDPLTPKRFISNFFHAPANTRVTVPKDPDDAVAKFC